MGKDSKLAVSDSKFASFVEANHSTVKSKERTRESIKVDHSVKQPNTN